MQTPEDVAAMVRLHALGWGTKRIARELGVSRTTVKRYVRHGGWKPFKKPERSRALDEHAGWLKEQFLQHGGNAEVVRQELEREKQVAVSLRTVERAVEPYRQELRAEAKKTVRFETRPGRQLQVDFGRCTVTIAGERVATHLCVLTLGYSRRQYVAAWPCERQAQWLESMERAFAHFGGVPEEMLVDNARALVLKHDLQTREVIFHPAFRAFCDHWKVTPRACAPYRARTKGKDERSVGYVKRNGIAGREFESWAALEAHLAWWLRNVADVRVHGTTGERPIDRFEREALALHPLADRPSFTLRRTLTRRVQSDACVEVDTNHYSVPYRHIGHEVTVDVVNDEVVVSYAGSEIARHRVEGGRRQWIVEPSHLEGVVRTPAVEEAPAESELLRPLAIYEQAVGGAL
jgi:transposase